MRRWTAGGVRCERTATRPRAPNAAVIRVIDDAEFLESLCGRAAPGGDRSVGWVDNMKKLCSRAFVVKQCKEDRKAYRINYNDANYAVPFDGCILIAKG